MKNFKLMTLSLLSAILSAVMMMSCSPAESVAEGFVLYDGEQVAEIYVSSDEHVSILRAVEDLQRDIEAVTGKKPQIVNDISKAGENAIFITSLKSPAVKSLSLNSKGLDGLFDSYRIHTMDRGLAIVGSDDLGTIYGIYNISEQIGVDPLYWWCDLDIVKQKRVVVEECEVEPRQPTVRYRAIFINDEEALIKWSGYTSVDKSKGAISPESYKRIFELMLRLKANTIWPSMMEPGSFFFEFKDENGVAINPKNATDYGIYIGTSHCENMGRNNYGEWYKWAEKNKHLFDMSLNNQGELEFDYTVNPRAIEIYWRQRIEESKNFNMIYTMGIRGVHDSAFMYRLMENPTLEKRVKLLQKVIDLQRQMLKEVFGSEDAVPQIFVPYEETAELYNGESKDFKEKCEGLKVPEDIIIVSTEDNYGYARQLPKEAEIARAGGCGIYYHLAYQGYPSPYDWLTTMPYPLMQQELRKIYEGGARKFWIVNVGDLKPTEMGLKLFLKMADDPEKYLYRPTEQYIEEQYSNIFDLNEKQTAEVVNIVEHFQSLGNSNKPEFMSSFWSLYFEESRHLFSFFSPFDFGDEVQQKIDEYRKLERQAKSLYDALPQSKQPSFWHTIYYPIRAARMMTEKSYYYHKNILYAKQGRLGSVNAYKALSLKAADEITKDLQYYNYEFMDGKWEGLTDPYGNYNITERVYDIAGIPEHFIYEERFAEEAQKGVGAVCEGQATGKENISLLFSSYEDNRRFIDVFNKNVAAEQWKLTPSAEWIKVSKGSGSVSCEERLWVTIDWSKAKAGENVGEIALEDVTGKVKSFKVSAMKYDMELQPKSYVEGSGFVTLEAELYSEKVDKNGATWNEVEKLGYCGNSMAVTGEGAELIYNVYFATAGEFTGTMYRIPTLNEGKDKSCSVGVGIDNEEPQILYGVRAKSSFMRTTLSNGKKDSRSWAKNVASQMEKLPFVIKVDKPGYHKVKVVGVDKYIAFDRIVIATAEQSFTAVNRSIIGPQVSYNNIASSYAKFVPVPSAELSEQITAVTPYRELDPMIYVKFCFSNYGNPAVWGFTPISNKTIFDPNKNLYGWGKEDVKNVVCGHNESTRVEPHWRRDHNRGTKPTKFYVSLLEGNYEMTIHSGMIRYYGYGGTAYDVYMTLSANGEELMNKELFKRDEPSSRTYDVRVGADHLLELEFSDKWSVSAIEFYRK